MSAMKRIALFVVTNLAVLVLLSIIVRILGIDALLAQQGIGADGLLVFAAAIGFGGAFISLAMSQWSAKTMMGVRTIDRPVTWSRNDPVPGFGDHMDVFNLPDNQTATRLSIVVCSYGHARSEIWPALE